MQKVKDILDVLRVTKTDSPSVLQVYRAYDHLQEVSLIRLLREATTLGLIEIVEVGEHISDHLIMLTQAGLDILNSTDRKLENIKRDLLNHIVHPDKNSNIES